MKQIKGLDSLRAYALILVVIAHWGPAFDHNAPIRRFIQVFFVPDGLFAVTLFFVLSGFLITSILLKAKTNDNGRQPARTIRNFFLRRALRIFPIYYLLLAFLYAINLGDVRTNIAYSLTYTLNMLCYKTNSWNSISHTWTLSIEEQFYLLWPWIIIYARDKYIKAILWTAIVAGAISSYIAVEKMSHMEPFLVFNCFDAFGIGGFYAYARLNPSTLPRFERAIRWLTVVAAIVYFNWKARFFLDLPFGPYISFIKTIDSIISVWLIMLVINNRSAIAKKYLLENRVLNYIGKISYGLYLYHIPFVTVVMPQLDPAIARIARPYLFLTRLAGNYAFNYWTHVAVLIAIAMFSYHFIEQPLLGLKKFFMYASPDENSQGCNSRTESSETGASMVGYQLTARYAGMYSNKKAKAGI